MPCFTASISPLGISPTNVLADNEQLIDIIETSVVGDEIVEPKYKAPSFDESTLIEFEDSTPDEYDESDLDIQRQ